MIRAKILMIGSNLKGVETELKHSGIRCTELVSNCSPLSMVGKPDESIVEICERIDDMPTHLDIKKNLAQMLSKDSAGFVQNYNTMPYGKNVDYFNPAEYIIVSNTSLAYKLFFNGEFVYTAHLKNELSRLVENDASYRRLELPSDEIDWKMLYGQFVDTILKEYDSKHIILIKTNTAKYYMEGNEIKPFGSEFDEIRKLIDEADRIFAKKTNCIEVDEAYNHIPTAYDTKSAAPFGELNDVCVYDISRIIEDIIFNGVLPERAGDEFAEINDIIGLYYRYENALDKTAIKAEISELVSAKKAFPITKAIRLHEKNTVFLAKHPYISDNLKGFPSIEKFYIGLGNNIYIVLCPTSENPITKIELPIQNVVDYNRIIENGYVCRIWDADAICGCLSFYIERARRGDGQHPIKIEFSSKEEFYESLNFIDYPDLNENESFLLGTEQDEFDTSKHEVRCDLGFFFDPNVKICVLDNGLGDQITYYIFAKRLEDYTGSEIYYDDLVYYFDYIMNDREIDRIIKEDISGRLFSNIFTRKLLLNFSIGDVIPDKLAENGLRELTVIANNNEEHGDAVKKCNKICLCAIKHEYFDKILDCGFFPLYFNYYIRPEWLMTLRPFELREYLEFPKTTEKNREIEEKMLACDAVAIQMRRGDFVRLGWASDTAFYAEAIEKLSVITDYPNKKFFVFSDDIPWIRSHSKEMGLDDAGGEVVYVDHNKNEDCLFDMYLISLAKVVIGSASGFVKMGALFSMRCEDFFCDNPKVKGVFEAAGRKNKHDVVFDDISAPDYLNTLSIRYKSRKLYAV